MARCSRPNATRAELLRGGPALADTPRLSGKHDSSESRGGAAEARHGPPGQLVTTGTGCLSRAQNHSC